MTRGPSNDSTQFPEAIIQATKHLRFDRLLADAAYDGEHNHRLCREQLGIRSTVIPLNVRRSGRRWPSTKYRRQMKKRFHKRIYNNRWLVESAISRNKRLFGSALRATSEPGKDRECLLRVLTHNLMILRLPIQRFSTEQASNKMARGPRCERGGLDCKVYPPLAGKRGAISLGEIW